MSILERIDSSADVKRLRRDELPALCEELRAFIVENVAKTGGHLASNLGTVELTVALHRVYDSEKDRIVFDVGHQSYTHKILTGRRERFSTLRQFGGLSGFPKPYEAVDDAFIAGHASNSVSVALGMARARTLRKENYHVAAVIGDGAMTGGLAYEGLTNAAASGEPLLIILNDNNMSINENVGGTVRLLQKLRSRAAYINFKRWYRDAFSHLPALYRFNHRVKEWLKSRLLPNNMFSEMGLYYLGPVDGHNLKRLETAIRYARDAAAPVLLHVLTKKGKGCAYAEREPDVYHGVPPFDAKSGALPEPKLCFSSVFGETLCALARENEAVTALTAAMADGTGLDEFKRRFPARFFDIGIAEGHGAAMAGGMAKQGLIPVFAVYASFLQRSYDMLIHDVALQRLHAVFAVDRAGLVGSDGETHHGSFDAAFLGTVPGMKIYCPASFEELRVMLRKAVLHDDGPVALRYPRGGEGRYRGASLEEESLLREGNAITLVSYGVLINEVLDAADRLHEQGIEAEIVKLNCLRPNAFSRCLASLRKTRRLLVAEEVCEAGCAGERILARCCEEGIGLEKSLLRNLGDGIAPHGRVDELLRLYRMDGEQLAEAALRLCTGEET